MPQIQLTQKFDTLQTTWVLLFHGPGQLNDLFRGVLGRGNGHPRFYLCCSDGAANHVFLYLSFVPHQPKQSLVFGQLDQDLRIGVDGIHAIMQSSCLFKNFESGSYICRKTLIQFFPMLLKRLAAQVHPAATNSQHAVRIEAKLTHPT